MDTRAWEKTEKAQEILDRNGMSAECYPHHELPVVCVEIRWGDWKHDHQRCKWLLAQEGFVSFGEEITEDDGSDCYSAIHYFA